MEKEKAQGRSIADSPFFKKILQKAERYLKRPSEVAVLLQEAFKKAAARQSVGTLATEAWENLQLLSRMLKAATSGDYKGIPTATLAGGVAVVIYFIMPLDLVPDIIPAIGLLDDAALLAWFMASIKAELDKYKEWEATRPIPVTESAKPQPDTTHNADPSFGTPKYSDNTEAAVQIETKTDV